METKNRKITRDWRTFTSQSQKHPKISLTIMVTIQKQGLFSGRTMDFSFLDIFEMSKIENLNVYRENYFKSLEEFPNNIYYKTT